MSTLLDYYQFSQLATAAYIKLDGLALNSTVLVSEANDQNRIPTNLANQLFNPDFGSNTEASVWHIPTYFTSDVEGNLTSGGYYGNDDTGFAATLFEKDGEKVLAIRGTEGGGTASDIYQDLLNADLAQIGFIGFALEQTVSMINHILRLRAPKDSQVIQVQIDVSREPAENSIAVDGGAAYITFNTDTALGYGLIGDDEQITLTGHSLGGHLAVMATRLFPDLVKDTYIYNAPGFDPEFSSEVADGIGLIAGGIPLILSQLLVPNELRLTDEFVDFIGEFLPSIPASSFSGLPIHNLESEDLAPGDDVSVVASVITNQQAISEPQYVTTEGNSHLIEPFMDSMALHATFYKLDNSLTLNEINSLYQSAAHETPKTDKNLIVSLYKLFVGDTIIDGETGADTEIEIYLPDIDIELGFDKGIGSGDTAERNRHFQAILAIETSQPYKNLRGKAVLIDLSTYDSSSIIAVNAENSIAFRYALLNLNPFAILGDDSIYEQHNTNGELDLYDAETQTGSITEQYLQDRSHYLTQFLEVNKTDAPIYLSRDFEYLKDITTGRVLASGSAIDAVGAFPAFEYTVFGSKDADIINGSGNDDHLYGMDGVDTISAGNGDDYIEGGAGVDTIDGGAGEDTIYGGKDGDTLNGGDDDDTLYGNEGIDTLNGDVGDDTLYGGADNDRLHGGSDDDDLCGGIGNDRLYGDSGSDKLYGEDRDDVLYWEGR